MDNFVPVLTAVISSTAVWSFLQWLLSRRERNRAEARADVREKSFREKADYEHSRLLAEAQATAQRTALQSANERYKTLQSDYLAIREDLYRLRQATALVLTAFEKVLADARVADDTGKLWAAFTAEEVDTARKAIDMARKSLY